jgi:predicted  nucleic acid-binding Zn-ribbon protein
MPQQEPDATHPGPDAHRFQRAEPGYEVVDPEGTMVELEQEHRDRESDLLVQFSDMDNRARSYEERLDEMASTNAGLREALCNEELGTEARINAVKQQLDAALQHQASINTQIAALQGELRVTIAMANSMKVKSCMTLGKDTKASSECALTMVRSSGLSCRHSIRV